MTYILTYIVWAIFTSAFVIVWAIPAIERGKGECFWLSMSWFMATGYAVAFYRLVA